MVRISLLLLIFMAAAGAQSIYDLSGTGQFHRAYFEPGANEVTFEPFQDLNWEAKARTALPWLNLDRPTPAQIARLSPFESAGPQFRSVDFRAPLDSIVSRVTYLLIYDTGVAQLQPTQLKGSVSFDFDTDMKAVIRKVAAGDIVGKPLPVVTSAAFAITGRPADVSSTQPNAKFEKRMQAGDPVFDFIDGSRKYTWTTTSKNQPEVSSAFSFRLAGRQLLLVKWKIDFCENAYTLFSVDATLKPIAGNLYRCDA